MKIQPESAEAHNNLALALWQAGQLREAIAHCWELALKIKPDYPRLKMIWRGCSPLKPAEGGDPVRAVALPSEPAISQGIKYRGMSTLWQPLRSRWQV